MKSLDVYVTIIQLKFFLIFVDTVLRSVRNRYNSSVPALGCPSQIWSAAIISRRRINHIRLGTIINEGRLNSGGICCSNNRTDAGRHSRSGSINL